MNMSNLGFTFICEQEHKHTVWTYGYRDSYNSDTKQAAFELTIADNMLNGTYSLSQVRIWDAYSNWETYYPAGWNYPDDPGNPGEIDFDAVWFVIATPDILPEAVSIPTALSLPVRSTKTIHPAVTPPESIPDWTWVSGDSNIAEAENGILNGYGDGYLNPGGPATRAQIAQMLSNYLFLYSNL